MFSFVIEMGKLVICIAFVGLISCTSSEDKGAVLAKVYDEELFEEDLKLHLRNIQYDQTDSATIATEFIDLWVKDQILVHEAKENEDIEHKQIEKKAEDFKRDIYILELEQLLVDQKLDTNISAKEVKEYYDSHEQDFQLNDYLVKVLYIKIPFDAPDVEQIGSKYKLYRETDIEEIEVYAKIYASNYYYDEDSWIYFDDLLKEIPLHDINKDRFILKRSKTRFEENGFYYFLNIIDYKLKNTISPLSFETNNIKERILNVRIKELREEIKNEIIAKAYESKAVTIY